MFVMTSDSGGAGGKGGRGGCEWRREKKVENIAHMVQVMVAKAKQEVSLEELKEL